MAQSLKTVFNNSSTNSSGSLKSYFKNRPVVYTPMIAGRLKPGAAVPKYTPSATVLPKHIPTQLSALAMPFSTKPTQDLVDFKKQQLDDTWTKQADMAAAMDASDKGLVDRYNLLKGQITIGEDTLSKYQKDLMTQRMYEYMRRKPQYTTTQLNELAMPFSSKPTQELVDLKKQQLAPMRTQQADMSAAMDTSDKKLVDDYNALSGQINVREDTLNTYKEDVYEQERVKKKVQLERVVKNEDFATLSGYVGKDTKGIKGVLRYVSDDDYKAQFDKKLDFIVKLTKGDITSIALHNKVYKYGALNEMTDEETKVLQYYAAQDDWESVQEYYDTIERDLEDRYQRRVSKQTEDFANEHKLAGAVMNVGASLTQPTAYAATFWQNFKNGITDTYEPINTNSVLFAGAHMVQDTTKGITRDMTGIGKFAAETGLSIGQIAVTLPFGPQVSVAILGTSAAGQTALTATQNGASAGEALQIATAAGAVEYLTEKIPLGRLFKTAELGKASYINALKEIAEQAGVEGMKAVIAEYANTLSDEVIMDASSQLNQCVEQLKEQGFSDEKAKREAFVQLFITDPILAGAGGAITGGFMEATQR